MAILYYQLQQPYVKGLHNLSNGSIIYVNSGIGFLGPPIFSTFTAL